MTLGGHARQTPDKGIHPSVSWTFADSTARAAFTVTAGIPTSSGDLVTADLYKFGLQLDDNSIWVLVGIGPVTWMLLGGLDLNAIHDNVASEISALTLVTPETGDHILIEDSSDSNNKKRIAASSLSNLGPPATHAASHASGQSDEITVDNLASSSSNTYDRLRPDGSGGLEWIASDDLIDSDTGNSTTSGTTYLTKVSIVIPAEDATFLIRASALVSHSNTTGNPSARLQNTTDATTLGRVWISEMTDAANITSAVLEWEYAQTAAAGAKTIALQYALESGTGTMTISNAIITARRAIS